MIANVQQKKSIHKTPNKQNKENPHLIGGDFRLGCRDVMYRVATGNPICISIHTFC